MEETIKLNMTWPGIKTDVISIVLYCRECQLAKRLRRNYGKVPPKNAHVTPWQEVHVDCIGPYNVIHKKRIKQKNETTGKMVIKVQKVTRVLRAMTMIDPVTSWFQIISIPDEEMTSDKIANIFHYT